MSRDLRDCCNPLLNPARTLTRSETETQRRFTFPSRLATKTGNSYDLTYSIEHDPQSLGDWCNGSTTDSGSVSLGSNPRSPACNSLLLNMLCKLTLSSWQHLWNGVGVALLVLKALIAKQLPFAKPPGALAQGSRCPESVTPVSGDVLLPPSKLGGFGNTLLATNVRDCQSFGQVVVRFAQRVCHLLGGLSPSHKSLRCSGYWKTLISAGLIFGERTKTASSFPVSLPTVSARTPWIPIKCGDSSTKNNF